MRDPGSPDPPAELVKAIVRYVLAHPGAKDTVEGVMRWWLPGTAEGMGREDVEAGLGVLVARGWLTERAVATARKVYCLNPDGLAEMRAFTADE